jgi:hypothetical protein
VPNCVARLVLINAIACCACGAQSSRGAPSSGGESALPADQSTEAGAAAGASSGEPASATPASEADCLGRGAEAPQEPGSPLWLNSYDVREISDIASDAAGNVLLACAGSATLKLDREGALLWSKPFGSLVAVADDGSVYVAGSLGNSLELGSGELRSRGGRDAFVVKLARDGAVVYGVTLGGSEDDEPLSLAVDGAQRVIISGAGLGTVQLDELGNALWQKNFFGKLAADSSGNTWLTGALVGSQDFGGGVLTSRGGADIFVVKLGPRGEHLFSKSFGDSAEQQGEGIAVDRDDNVFIAGVFASSVDWGPGALMLKPATCPAEAWCKTSGFVAKLDAQGDALWSASLGPMRALPGVATDSHGNVVLSGALPGGVTPFRQPWVSELDSSGAELWRRAEWPESGLGAGHLVAVDVCDAPLWSISARPALQVDERWYVAKLAP